MSAEVDLFEAGSPLAGLRQAREILASERNLDAVLSIRDTALAAAEYARAKRLGEESVRYATEIATRAERRLGELLPDVPKAAGGDHRSAEFKTAESEDLKTPRQQVGWKVSARSQALAKIPEAEFERQMAQERTITADRLLRIQRDQEAQQRRVDEARLEAERRPEPLRVDIRHGDFREVLADLTDVDAVITDPPYPREFLPLLADLAAWADKVLGPAGVLADYRVHGEGSAGPGTTASAGADVTG